MGRQIKIWSFGDVDRSGKVRWTAEELGYEVEEARLEPGEQAADPYAQVNPYRQIPAAGLDGEIFIESTAISLLLAERHPEAGLIPEGRKSRVLFWQSVAVSGNTLEMPVVNCFLSRAGVIDAAWADLLVKPLRARLGVFSRSMPAEGYICGKFTLADNFAANVLRIGVQADLLPLNGSLESYLRRLASRPAAQAARFFERLEF